MGNWSNHSLCLFDRSLFQVLGNLLFDHCFVVLVLFNHLRKWVHRLERERDFEKISPLRHEQIKLSRETERALTVGWLIARFISHTIHEIVFEINTHLNVLESGYLCIQNTLQSTITLGALRSPIVFPDLDLVEIQSKIDQWFKNGENFEILKMYKLKRKTNEKLNSKS